MVCPKCSSENINTQIVSDIKLKTKHHGIIYWLCFGWLWSFFCWIIFTIPKLILAIFGHKKQKIVTKNYTMAVCQNCHYSWKVK